MGSVIKVIDNSGAKTVRCIKPEGGTGKREARLGEIIMVSVQEAIPRSKVKPGEIYPAIIVTQRGEHKRDDGSTIKCSQTSVVLFDRKDYTLIGTRITAPVLREVSDPKIRSLAPEVI